MSMEKKALCLIEQHEYMWRIEGLVRDQPAGIPDRAICKHCGQKYGNKKKQV